VNPLSSYSFEQVGISVTATPRVTDEGDILMTLALKNSALGPSRTVGGSPAPSFTNREVTANLRLRDGESHMLAGLLQDEERRTLRGFPGIVSMPILRDLFSDNDSNIQQTDIVMLLTPRIIRTHEFTASDLAPIYLGTNQNFGLTGPPPLIAAPPENPPAPSAPVTPPAQQGIPPQGMPVPSVPQTGTPGLITTPAPAPPPTTLAPPVPPAASPQALAEPSVPPTPVPTPTTAAQVSVTPPAGDVRVAGGPYIVPVFVSGASRLSNVTVTVTYNPAVLRVRTVQEGSFLRQGAAPVTFTNRVDATLGRVDLTFVRTRDAVGASGSGLLAGIMFDAVGTGTSQLNVSGAATDPAGSPMPLQFTPVTVVVR
jgi:general secretion pathway protein D